MSKLPDLVLVVEDLVLGRIERGAGARVHEALVTDRGVPGTVVEPRLDGGGGMCVRTWGACGCAFGCGCFVGEEKEEMAGRGGEGERKNREGEGEQKEREGRGEREGERWEAGGWRWEGERERAGKTDTL